jgi:hypothetical protein
MAISYCSVPFRCPRHGRSLRTQLPVQIPYGNLYVEPKPAPYLPMAPNVKGHPLTEWAAGPTRRLRTWAIYQFRMFIVEINQYA